MTEIETKIIDSGLKEFFKGEILSDIYFVSQIQVNYIQNDDLEIIRNITLNIKKDLTSNNSLCVNFMEVNTAIIPDNVPFQLSLEFIDCRDWGWEHTRFKIKSYDQDNDFEIICRDFRLEKI